MAEMWPIKALTSYGTVTQSWFPQDCYVPQSDLKVILTQAVVVLRPFAARMKP